MTDACRIRSPIIAAILLTLAASAQEPCPATPEKYRKQDFGDVRFAIEEGCARPYTQTDQFFVAAVAQTLLGNCKLPKDREGREAVERFTKASAIAMAYPNSDAPLDQAITSMSQSASAFAAGKSMMEDIPCKGPEAALLSRGIVIYLKRTSRDSRFVAGCVEWYAGRYTEKQCRCVAETLRAVLPDIDQRYFNRELIGESIHRSPFIAFPLMFSCGVGNY